MSADTLLSRLDKAKPRGKGQWLAPCPSHEDRSPSLSVRETDDGTVLVHCFAGCNVTDILDAVGMDLAELFPERMEHHNNHRRGRPRIDGWDALRSLGKHVTAVVLAAEHVRRGEPLSDEDMETLIDAAAAIERVRRYSHAIA